MIHSWGENIAVRPRSVTIIEEGGQFISNYVCMEKVKDVQMYPTTKLVGEGAVARLNSILVAPEGSHLDIGRKALLEVPGTVLFLPAVRSSTAAILQVVPKAFVPIWNVMA